MIPLETRRSINNPAVEARNNTVKKA